MTFKEIREGSPVYLLHWGDTIKASQGKVVSVSVPRMPMPFQQIGQTSQMLIDISIEDDGHTKAYSIPETLEVTYAGQDLAISVTKEGIIREVEMLKQKAEDVISSVDKNRTNLSRCNEILAEWNPAYKEKRDTEERFGKLENRLDEVATMVKNLVTKLS